MFLQSFLCATLLALPALSLYTDVKRSTGFQNHKRGSNGTLPTLPPCGPDPGPCTCPEGTMYETSTTYAIYPAAASDITAIIGDFFSTEWFGIALYNSTGSGTTAGARRSAYEPVPMGVGELLTSEELTNWTTTEDGGFTYHYEGIDLPMKFQKTDGTTGQVAGSWEFIDARSAGEDSSVIVWGMHACLTDIWELAAFHESALKNVSSILEGQGLLNGDLDGPYSF